MSTGPYEAVFFDIGGPIDAEPKSELLIDRDLMAAPAAEGVEATPEEFAQANGYAVASFAPDTHRAMLWHLAGGNGTVACRACGRFREFATSRLTEAGELEVRPGMEEFLADLGAAGCTLGLAANQPAAMTGALAAAGLLHHFHEARASEHHGFRKPDPRLALAVCAALEVAPERCVMVGDRIDNDIVPARLLRMATVLLRTGRHRGQRPRSWGEVPDFIVYDVAGIRNSLAALGLLGRQGTA